MKLLGSPFISAITISIFTYFMFRYWKLLSKHPRRFRYLLFSLRTISLMCFIFLLLNPGMYWTKNEQNPQKVSVIFDLSESMFSHLEDYPFKFDQIQKTINIWGTRHDLNMDFFQLGKKIRKIHDMESAYPITDYTDIPNFISFEQPHQLLLITDGKRQEGKISMKLNLARLILYTQ